MTDKDQIGKSLNLDPLVPLQPTQITKGGKIISDNNDYEYARKNLYDVIEKGSTALEDILDVARQSESPRAYEVVTNLIKTMVDANKDLLQLSKTKKELEKEDNVNTNVTNNNLFVGSSAELLKMIKDKSNES